MFFNLILPFIEGVIYCQPISLILLTPPPAPPLQGWGVLVTVPFLCMRTPCRFPAPEGEGLGVGTVLFSFLFGTD